MIPRTSSEADYRFSGTYLRTQTGEIGRVDGCSGTRLLMRELINGDSFEVSFNDTVFDYPALGYINHKHICINTSRTTSRGYKRGFLPDGIFTELVGNYNVSLGRLPRSSNALFIKDIMLPKYPDAKTAIKEVMDADALARAWTPNLAVGVYNNHVNPVLYYNGVVVGYVKEDTIFLPSHYDFVAEELDDSLNMEFIK